MSAADAENALVSGAVAFAQAPQGAQQFTLPLAVSEAPGGRSQGYLSQRSPRPLEELASVPPAIASTYTGKEFYAYQIASMADGTRYLVVLNEDSGIRFLNRSDFGGMWYARIYRVPEPAGGNPELVEEGYQSSGNDVVIPVELKLPGIGTTKLKSLKTELGYSINSYQNGKPQVYSGRGTALQVAGSQVAPQGKLTVTVSVPDELAVTPETQVTLRFEPLQPGLPEHTAAGKVTDFLTLGPARFVVTALAPDFSSMTLALVSGSLEQALKQQLQLGAQMPVFAQVDLVTRKTVTQSEVLGKAKSTPGVVFVFGDLDTPGSRFGSGPMYRPPGSPTLPLPAPEVVEQLGLDLQPKPIIVLVTRQIGMDFLYSELRNKTPEYVVLTDFADPLRTMFRQPQNNPGPYYGGPPFGGGQEPSLRQVFNFPANILAIVAFDPQGKVRYVKADAGSSFLPSLAEARAALAPREAAR